jgi:hypothetical protein
MDSVRLLREAKGDAEIQTRHVRTHGARGTAQMHGWEERRRRHRDTMQCKTTNRARVLPLMCADGCTEVAAAPWAERRWLDVPELK